MSEDDAREVNFRVDVPEEESVGVYANFLSVWHTAHEFTLDFAASQTPELVDPHDEGSPLVVPCRVSARVRIPVSLVFDVLRALNENMGRYEDTFGDLHRPEPKGEDE